MKPLILPIGDNLLFSDGIGESVFVAGNKELVLQCRMLDYYFKTNGTIASLTSAFVCTVVTYSLRDKNMKPHYCRPNAKTQK